MATKFSCKTCIFYRQTNEYMPGYKSGDCRIDSPKSFQVSDGDGPSVWHGWPRVNDGDFCGAWKERPLASSHDRILATIPRLEALANGNGHGDAT